MSSATYTKVSTQRLQDYCDGKQLLSTSLNGTGSIEQLSSGRNNDPSVILPRSFTISVPHSKPLSNSLSWIVVKEGLAIVAMIQLKLRVFYNKSVEKTRQRLGGNFRHCYTILLIIYRVFVFDV
jgi:hypothetical protein